MSIELQFKGKIWHPESRYWHECCVLCWKKEKTLLISVVEGQEIIPFDMREAVGM